MGSVKYQLTPKEQQERIDKRRAKRLARKQYYKQNPKVRDYRLYALRLEHDKYYVGVTAYKDVRVRYQQHLVGTGAKWTALHKPIEIMEVREIGVLRQGDACILEDEMTLSYMAEYGVGNVRGGAVCMINETLAYNHYDKMYRNVNKPKKKMDRLEQIDMQIATLQKERDAILARRNHRIPEPDMSWIV